MRCIERPDVYENVSRNAFERFKNVELYADSITTAIEDIVSGCFAEV